MILPKSFYLRDDVLAIAKELLGKVLVSNIGGIVTSGIIVETEAYAGVTDKASHAYGGRPTKRTEIMYDEGGAIYVYLCYGIHHLFNVVTNLKSIPHAVLIRALEPLEGVDIMLTRRKKEKLIPEITAGPGSLTKALGITTGYNGSLLSQGLIHIEDRGINIEKKDILSRTRVGVAYAKEDALLPYRFSVDRNRYVSKAKGL